MKLYRIYLPKFDNDGTKILLKKISEISEDIREKFGAYSLDPFGKLPIIQGVWTSKVRKPYVEDMYVFDLFVEDTFDNKRWFKAMREVWRQKLGQEELFIVIQDAEIFFD